MPVPQDDDAAPSEARTSRTRQWARAALALAFLFASLPFAGKLFLDSWRFEDAPGMAGLCLVVAAYLYYAGRESRPPIPDSALMLDQALQLASRGSTGRAIALLNEALRLNPDLWQAWQYRGQIRLLEPPDAAAALHDFTQAIRLAPDEPHLYILRSRTFSLLGQEPAARADLDAAAQLERDAGLTARGPGSD